MRRLVLLTLTAAAAGACAAPYEAMPTSGYQWQRRQERIEREWRAEHPVAPVPAADAKDPS